MDKEQQVARLKELMDQAAKMGELPAISGMQGLDHKANKMFSLVFTLQYEMSELYDALLSKLKERAIEQQKFDKAVKNAIGAILTMASLAQIEPKDIIDSPYTPDLWTYATFGEYQKNLGYVAEECRRFYLHPGGQDFRQADIQFAITRLLRDLFVFASGYLDPERDKFIAFLEFGFED